MAVPCFKKASAFGFAFAIGLVVNPVFGATAALAAQGPPSLLGIPQISSTLYNPTDPMRWTDDSPSDSFTWNTASGPVQSYEYTEDGAKSVRIPASSRSLSWYPAAGAHKLSVRAVSTTGKLGTPATYRFTVVNPSTPNVPRSLTDTVSASANPVVSGLVSTADGGGMVVRFYVSDDSGTPIAGIPYATVSAASGTRQGVEIPSGLLLPGRQYTFEMEACAGVGSACSPRTSATPLAAHVPSSNSTATVPPSSSPLMALPELPETYVAAAKSFWTARQSLSLDVSRPTADALVGRAEPAMVRSLLSAEAPRLKTIRALELAHGGGTKSEPTIDFADPIVSMAADGTTVNVKMSINESFVGIDSSGNRRTTRSTQSVVFQFLPVDGAYVLDAYFDASALDGRAELLPSMDAQATTASSLAPDSAANSLAQAPPAASRAAGSLSASPTSALGASAASISQYDMVIWAHAHYQDPWQYNPGCTAFVSRALHEGGGVAFINGLWNNDHYWWRLTDGSNASYSYAGAQNLMNFLGYNSGSWLSYTYQAVPGDVIFYQYPGFANVNHSAVVTGTWVETGELWMTQQDTNYYDTSLTDQQARIKADTGGYATIWLRHVTM